MEAFELRLWDSRIGRWLSPDPYKEFDSPYMGMGNNPISTVDPSGGCTDCPDNAEIGATHTNKFGETFTMTKNGWGVGDGYAGSLNEVVVMAGGSGFSSTEFLSTATLLYGIAEGATGQIKDFDKITNALKNNTFLSSEFNLAGELRPYKLNPDGSAAYKGGGAGNYKAEDITKAANKFKAKGRLIKSLKATGVITNIVGVGLSGYDIYENGAGVENMSDTVIGLVAFVPGSYFLIVKPILVNSGPNPLYVPKIGEFENYEIKIDNTNVHIKFHNVYPIRL